MRKYIWDVQIALSIHSGLRAAHYSTAATALEGFLKVMDAMIRYILCQPTMSCTVQPSTTMAEVLRTSLLSPV